MSTEHTQILILAESPLVGSRNYCENSNQSFLIFISNTHVTGAKSVCVLHTLKGVRVWNTERFIDQEGANWEDGSPTRSSNASEESIEFRLLLCQGKGNGRDHFYKTQATTEFL